MFSPACPRDSPPPQRATDAPRLSGCGASSRHGSAHPGGSSSAHVWGCRDARAAASRAGEPGRPGLWPGHGQHLPGVPGAVPTAERFQYLAEPVCLNCLEEQWWVRFIFSSVVVVEQRITEAFWTVSGVGARGGAHLRSPAGPSGPSQPRPQPLAVTPPLCLWIGWFSGGERNYTILVLLCLISLGMMSKRFIHVAACVKISFEG